MEIFFDSFGVAFVFDWSSGWPLGRAIFLSLGNVLHYFFLLILFSRHFPCNKHEPNTKDINKTSESKTTAPG